ncbi:succinate dehydrogenase/fumarate reductase iron-sulfur subunit [Rhodobacteraceae bacterium NNCM2]|nr:succinate dehydrogenase/fumarate reductase iron-sulfur subunit [Coraliihabitans acroporae]
MADSEQLDVRIWRGRDEGAFAAYAVPMRNNQTVLDVVTEVQRRLEPALAYRFACRVGVCGSCAMMVNGVPRWTCRTHVSRVVEEGALTIEPLRNLPRIKDLVCDMTGFFEKWTRAGGTFEGTATRADSPAAIDPAGDKRRKVDAGIECINCAVCYAACDVVSWDAEYLGPAALNRAWTLVNDERAANAAEVKRAAQGVGGCGSCHSHGACVAACPVGLNPTQSIAGLKRRSLFDLLGGG